MTATVFFAREHLRAPLTLALLVGIPALFVFSAAGVLSDFADALGGSLAGQAAAALGAGWAAAFIAGALGFFQASSARGADRRLALAGLGAARVAMARIASALILALVASAAGFTALLIRSDIAHPFHAAVAVASFAVIYLAVGTVVGSLLNGQLEGSLAVAGVFLLDAFAGPGMSADPAPWAISRKAADVLISAASGGGSPDGDWLKLAGVVAVALGTAFAVFALSARPRT